jgi:hypothetical protein
MVEFMEVGGVTSEDVEIQKLLTMKFPLNKNGSPDGRRSEYRRLVSLGNGTSYPVNLDGKPDMRFTKNPDILRMKLAKAIAEKNNF